MDPTTNAAPSVPSTPSTTGDLSGRLTVRRPSASDGAAMWRVARDSGELDLNSSYAYLLLAQHFADTCRVALDGDLVVGFVSGYRLPEDAAHLFVWQVAVDESARGLGIAGRMLDDLVDETSGVTTLETTVAEDNVASRRLFARWAARRGAAITSRPLFTASQFPDSHVDEPLLVIAGLTPR
ncbi:diaminobutyrate acetyltransferase [Cellulosimicrobium terreum]|nr:diaminobutyrate acetyltransferase [Cellulosimicrobium terreum]